MATNNEAQVGSIVVNQPVAANTAAGSSANGSGASTAPSVSGGTSGSNTVSAGTTATTGLLPTLVNLANGVAGYLPADSMLTVNGQSLEVSQILTTLKGYIASGNAVSPLKAQWEVAVAAWGAERSDARAYATELRGALRTALGKSSPLLQQFGIAIGKPRAKLSGQKLVAMSAKSQATRALRSTKGSKQKAGIQYQGSVQVTATTQSQGSAGSGNALAAPAAPPGSPGGGTVAPAAQAAVKPQS